MKSKRKAVSGLSPKAEAAWGELDQEMRREIRKYNPSKWKRNRAILELKAKGVRSEILAEITGLHRGSIFRIAKKETLIPEKQTQEIRRLVETFEALLTALTRLLRRGDERKQS